MVIKICVGSSCHLKGSYNVIEVFKNLIKQHNLEDKIELTASFCLGKCSDGVTAMAGDKYVLNLNENNAADKFFSEIYPQL